MRNTIKNHTDFMTAPGDPSATATFFIVRAKKTRFPNDPRYGVIASKRTFKLAVHRNRAKRLIRDWLAYCDDLLLPEFDYVFIARASILTATRDMGRESMSRALNHIRLKYGTLDK